MPAKAIRLNLTAGALIPAAVKLAVAFYVATAAAKVWAAI